MEKLIDFITHRYQLCVKWNADPAKMCDQAFGALELYYTLNPNQFDECEHLWNEEWHPKFLRLMGVM